MITAHDSNPVHSFKQTHAQYGKTINFKVHLHEKKHFKIVYVITKLGNFWRNKNLTVVVSLVNVLPDGCVTGFLLTRGNLKNETNQLGKKRS